MKQWFPLTQAAGNLKLGAQLRRSLFKQVQTQAQPSLSTLNKTIFCAIFLMGLITHSPCSYAESIQNTTTSPKSFAEASAPKVADLTFPSGLVLAITAQNLILLSKNGQTIQLTYTQTTALLSELVSLKLLDQDTANKAQTLLNRLINEQSDSLSGPEMMSLDKPLSLVKTHYAGPALQDTSSKDSGIPLDLTLSSNSKSRVTLIAPPTPQNQDSLSDSTVIQHNSIMDPSPSTAPISGTTPSPMNKEDLQNEADFDESNIPDGSSDDWDSAAQPDLNQEGDKSTTDSAH